MPVSHRGILWISSDEMIEWGQKSNPPPNLLIYFFPTMNLFIVLIPEKLPTLIKPPRKIFWSIILVSWNLKYSSWDQWHVGLNSIYVKSLQFTKIFDFMFEMQYKRVFSIK